ncbi:MAG: potassium-transporting ATPase subunit KdpA [Azospirillum sp.]|nr:potassium-transporting ATPase subunit KdpA [Azospirillum sp.]
MTTQGWLEIALYLATVTGLALALGLYLAQVFQGKPTWATPAAAPVERLIFRLAGVDPAQEQHWTHYAGSVLAFTLVGILLLYGLMRVQDWLPLNPDGQAAVAPDLAFNTAVSFATNTNWQNYGGESAMSYFTQMAGLTVQNFQSAAAGLAVAVAVARGFARRSTRSVGNFWVDLVRAVLYLLLPASVIFALFLVGQGVPQTLGGAVVATGLDGVTQSIARGPVASQEAIKLLGTNGGGFFNVNSAHPFENPTPLANFAEMVALLVIPASLVVMFGRMVGDLRQGFALYAAMGVLLLAGLAVCYGAEAAGNPALTHLGIAPGGSLEGKEVRFGVVESVLFAVATTVTSCGAVNAMHDSFTALGGLVPLVNMMLGEVVFGGVGSGLYGMLVFVLVTVFIAGLMVGRTPEYLGKKIEAREIKLAVLSLLFFPLSVLGLSALSLVLPDGVASVGAPGPHGLSEAVYAYASATANNGSAFAGYNGNTLYANSLLGLAMLVGRFSVIIPVLAIAGALAAKKTIPPSAGTFPTHGILFVVLLVAVVLVVGGLTFFPVLALGPVAEHLAQASGRLF